MTQDASATDALAQWLHNVVKAHRAAGANATPKRVHELRLAIRRSRSLATAVSRLDPHPAWRTLSRVCKPLFSALGDLRDVHVKREWTKSLAPQDDPTAEALLKALKKQEKQQRRLAKQALGDFRMDRWKRLAKVLPARMAELRAHSSAFEVLALEQWVEAYSLHLKAAVRGESHAVWHQLRIAVKRFRYTVENFLPDLHASWGDNLKTMQDLLGEFHDLDVLWEALPQVGKVFDDDARDQWRARIAKAQQERMDRYRALTQKPRSLWRAWRAALPQGVALDNAILDRLSFWAEQLDPAFSKTCRVADIAQALLEALSRGGCGPAFADPRSHRLLRVAALLHNVDGSSSKQAAKQAAKAVRAMAPPPGWAEGEMELVAHIVHCQGGDDARAKAGNAAPKRDQALLTALAGILRLARAIHDIDAAHDGQMTIDASHQDVVLWARDINQTDASRLDIPDTKGLLELACGRRVHIYPSQVC